MKIFESKNQESVLVSAISGIINGSLQSVSMERLMRLATALDLSIDLKIKAAA